MIETMMTLLLGNPDLEITYTHKKNGKSYLLDSLVLKRQFKDRPLIDPEVIQWVKMHLREGLEQIGATG
jgi:hypothetical protein